MAVNHCSGHAAARFTSSVSTSYYNCSSATVPLGTLKIRVNNAPPCRKHLV